MGKTLINNLIQMTGTKFFPPLPTMEAPSIYELTKIIGQKIAENDTDGEYSERHLEYFQIA